MSGMTDRDRELIEATHSTIMLMREDQKDMQTTVDQLKDGQDALKVDVGNIKELIDPDKIKNKDAKGMLDVDREHDVRLAALEDHVSDCAHRMTGTSTPAQPVPVPGPENTAQQPQSLLMGLLSGLTPQQQLFLLVLLFVALGSGASAERIFRLLGGS